MKTHAKFFARADKAQSGLGKSPRIASICSEMPNMTILKANVAAALDKNELSYQDRRLLEGYAHESAFGYCAGCAKLCESALNHTVPICDIMRYLMYHDEYDSPQRAVRLFHDLHPMIRKNLALINYSSAEQRCPQKLPIARLMNRAVKVLSMNVTRIV